MTYPEFYNAPTGDLVFLYRDGESGDGDVYMNRYDVQTQSWIPLQHPLLSGEGKRNPYLNRMAFGPDGAWHLSWCWRESSNVASNHDLMYAVSYDAGSTWQRSDGRPYTLPIVESTAEIIVSIPEGSTYINQTATTVKPDGHPVIASYWQTPEDSAPQYRVVFYDGATWHTRSISQRSTPFELGGRGTRRVPLARPEVISDSTAVYVFFRDEERGDVPSVAISRDALLMNWDIWDLSAQRVGLWEPNIDHLLWQQTGRVHLFLQRVGQGSGERLDHVGPQHVSILEWTPALSKN